MGFGSSRGRFFRGFEVGAGVLGLLGFLINTAFAVENLHKPLRVIALTDLHGALEPQVLKTKAGETVNAGGAALASSFIKILRDSDGIPWVLVDAGDLFQGTLVSNSAEGRPVIEFYNYLGVDAAAIGNHEFDYGPVGFKAVPSDSKDDPRGAFKERVREARFPFLAVNIFNEDGSRPEWSKPSVFVEKGGLKIGIIGFAAEETPQTTNRKNLVGLTFRDPVQYIISEASALRKAGADYVILIGHSGGGCGDNSPKSWTDLSSCEPGALFKILKSLPKHLIDLAVGGHTHQGVAKSVEGIPVLQPFSNSKFFGTVVLSKQGNETVSDVGRLVEICDSGFIKAGDVTCASSVVTQSEEKVQKATYLSQEVVPDPSVLTLLDSDFNRVSEIKMQPLGVRTLGRFRHAFFEENALGNFLTDVLLSSVKGVDLAVLNNGGLRTDLAQKDLTYEDIFNILPFDNTLAILNVNGDELIKIFELGISRKAGGLSWSKLRFAAERGRVLSAEVGGALVDRARVYRVLTSDYLAGGGSHFDSLGLVPEQIEFLDRMPNLREQMILGLKSYSGSWIPKDYYDAKNPRQMIVKTPQR